MFFFEKKYQKTFAPGDMGRCGDNGPLEQKFLGRLFSSRRVL
jgi:hypothetical protein